jgi:acyl carrier protein
VTIDPERGDLDVQLRRYVLEEINLLSPDHALADDEDLIDNGLLTSVGVLLLVSHLEEHFGIEVASDRLDDGTFRTLRRIRSYMGSVVGSV